MTWQREHMHEVRQNRSVERSVSRAATPAVGGNRTRAKLAAVKLSAVRPAVVNTRSENVRQIKPRAAEQGVALEVKGEHANRDHEGYLIKELQQLLRTQIEARLRARGLWLSFPHSAVLMTLGEEPGMSGAQLARRFSVTAQTMNGLLLPLESKGLIERRPDPENARVLKCYLRPKGSNNMKSGMQEAGAVFDQMLGTLSSRERTEFRGILRRCIEALQSRAARV